jgi:hypothetical protein
VPTTDTFTFRHTGEAWTNGAWLMQLAHYGLLRAGGPPLVVFVFGLVVAGGYLLLRRCLVSLSGDLRLATVLTIWAGVVGFQNWAVRPQGISFLCFGLALWLIVRHRLRGGRWLWGLPPLFVLWSNAHGGFIFGLALVGCYALAMIWEAVEWTPPARPTLAATLRSLPWRNGLLPAPACLVAPALNPAGPMGMVDYVLGFVRNRGTMTLNMEFRALTVENVTGGAFFLGVAALATLFIRRRHRPDAFETPALLLFGALALWAHRNPPWFAFVAAAAAARAVGVTRTAPPIQAHGVTVANALLLGLFGAALILSLPWLRPYLPRNLTCGEIVHVYTPVEATDYLCEEMTGSDRLFNDMSYGSYIAWACPQVPVFVDTRFELYSYEEWLEYLALMNARYDWQAILDGYGITHLLLHPEDQEHLLAAARDSACWRERFTERAVVGEEEDEIAVVLERDAAACPLP